MALESVVVDVRRIPSAGSRISLVADDEARAGLAQSYDVVSVEAFRIDGMIRSLGPGRFHLSARIRAEITQECVVTLEPVQTSIDEAVDQEFAQESNAPSHMQARRRPDAAGDDDDDGIEVDPDAPEPFRGIQCDVTPFLLECFSLAIPDYPRKRGASVAEDAMSEPEELSSLARQLLALKGRVGDT